MKQKLHLICDVNSADRIEGEIAIARNITARQFRTKRQQSKTSKSFCYLLIVRQGNIHCDVENKPTLVGWGEMLVVLFDTLTIIRDVSNDLCCDAVFITNAFLSRLALTDAFGANLSIGRNPRIALGEEGLVSMDNYLTMMQQMIRHADNPYRLDCLRSLTEAFFYGAGYYWHLQHKVLDKHMPDIITEQFLQLLQQHGHAEHTLAFYANRLCVSPKYLSACVTNVTGVTALKHLQRHIVQHADRMLRSRSKTLSDVAAALGFPTTEAFSHYYRRATGHSPSSLRRHTSPQADNLGSSKSNNNFSET